MWTEDNRKTYEHKTARYPSDLTDAEWALIEPFLPPPTKSRRHKALERRNIMDGIFYVLSTGCQWRMLPKDFPSKSAVHKYMIRLQVDGILTQIHHALYALTRVKAGKNAEPTLSIVDSQSVKSAEKGGAKLIRPGMTQARKSRAKNVTSPSIRSV
jgi:transposase